MKPAICIGCGCDEGHACEVTYFNGLAEQQMGCWWLRFDAAENTGVCSQCEDLVKGWDQGQRRPILALIAERYYRQVLFLYEDKASALAWMRAPQQLLCGRAPYDLILAGELERVQALVDQLATGAFV